MRRKRRRGARGEKPPPEWPGTQTFESVEAVVRPLTPENPPLLALVRDRKPRSIAEPPEISGRAASTLARSLARLEAIGLIRLEGASERRRVPTAVVHTLRVEIDPFSQNNRLEIT